MVLAYHNLHLRRSQPSVREHADLISDVVPGPYVISSLPGVLMLYSSSLSLFLISIILPATSFSSAIHVFLVS